jgi:tetratricopeptide (TPR) repeat protein
LGAHSNLNSALHNIDIGNYHDAIAQLKSTPLAERDGYSVNFYSGVVYQELGEYSSAINSFTEVVRHGDNLLVEQSEWYIGLCYLRTDEREKALAQFRTIVSRKGFYGEQSRKLLKQLE